MKLPWTSDEADQNTPSDDSELAGGTLSRNGAGADAGAERRDETTGASAEGRAEAAVARATEAAEHAETARLEADVAAEHVKTLAVQVDDTVDYLHGPHEALSRPGVPLNAHSPFIFGLLAAFGALLAYWLGGLILQISSVLILIIVSFFIAVGLNPAVEFFMRRGLRRPWAVLIVIVGVLAAVALFVVAIAPIVSEQVAAITKNAPGWLDQLQNNTQVQKLDAKYDLIDKATAYIEEGGWAQRVFGGALGFGLKLLGFLANVFVVVVLTLYFLASLPSAKRAMYQLAPASRRARVSGLGDRILQSVGGYVSGAFIVALCAGLSTLVFLFVVGMGEYAVALALVVAILDVIPMIGATLGAVIVCAIGFANDPKTGLVCVIFYVLYQQLENYVIYPKVMSRSVDVPGSVTVIAALAGASLLGVIGALLAIPVAASILLLIKEVWVPRQEAR